MIYPTRPKDRALKIDPAIALVMALRSISRVPLEETMYGDWDGTIRFLEDFVPKKTLEKTEKDQQEQSASKAQREAEQEEQRKAAEKSQQEFLTALYAIPQGRFLVIEDRNGKQRRVSRQEGASLVALGKVRLIRVES